MTKRKEEKFEVPNSVADIKKLVQEAKATVPEVSDDEVIDTIERLLKQLAALFGEAHNRDLEVSYSMIQPIPGQWTPLYSVKRILRKPPEPPKQ